MPKRSRSGLVSMPARVVAPTSVNGCRSSLIERAAGPSPIMMSIWKSSSAGYRISSTTGDSRWISSMNSTSLRSRPVRMAARSLGFSSTGPEVWRRLTPSSAAMMWLSVVLPRPGGPHGRTGSREVGAQLGRDDVAQRVLARARRAEQQHVVERFGALAGGADEDVELLAGLDLADVVGTALGPQSVPHRLFGGAR